MLSDSPNVVVKRSVFVGSHRTQKLICLWQTTCERGSRTRRVLAIPLFQWALHGSNIHEFPGDYAYYRRIHPGVVLPERVAASIRVNFHPIRERPSSSQLQFAVLAAPMRFIEPADHARFSAVHFVAGYALWHLRNP